MILLVLALAVQQAQDLSRFTARDRISLEYYKPILGPDYDAAQTAFTEGDYRLAAELFLKLHDVSGQAVALFLAGNAFYHLEEFDRAIELYRQAADRGLDRMPDLHYNLANAYYSKYRRPEAIRAFEKVLDLTSGADPMAHYHLGIILDGEGRHTDAIRHYRKTVELTNDGEPMAHQHLGVSYFMNGEFDQSVRELEIYLRQVPDDAGGNLNLGIALRYSKREREAIEQLRLAITKSRDTLPAAHYQLARILGARGDYDAALEHFRIALERGVRSPRTEAEFEALRKEASGKKR